MEGWFKDTIPILEKKIHKIGISVLRLDCDWYSSTEVSLNYLCPIVSENSIVIVDDYYAWDGSARAVHDYFSRSDLPYRIKSLPYNFGAYFIKRKFRDDFQQF